LTDNITKRASLASFRVISPIKLQILERIESDCKDTKGLNKNKKGYRVKNFVIL
jgi:hypothetical protein